MDKSSVPCENDIIDDGSSSSSCWKVAPVSRHYSTVGIGEAFVVPPPHETLHHYNVMNRVITPKLSSSSTAASAENTPVVTWEIVGTIKRTAEDFIVREIGGHQKDHSLRTDVHDNDNGIERSRIANITDVTTLPPPLLLHSTPLSEDIPLGEIENVSERESGCERVQQKERYESCNKNTDSTDNTDGKAHVDIKDVSLHSKLEQNATSNPLEHEGEGEGEQPSGGKYDIHLNQSSKDGQSQVKTIITQHKQHDECTKRDNPLDILENILLNNLLQIPAVPQSDIQQQQQQQQSCNSTTSATSVRGMSILKQIQALHDEATNELSTSTLHHNASSTHDKQITLPVHDTVIDVDTSKYILIPPILDEDNSIIIENESDIAIATVPSSLIPVAVNKKKKACWNRGVFHRTLKLAFPLLQTSTLSQEQSNLQIRNMDLLPPTTIGTNDGNVAINHNDGQLRCVRVEKDTTFHAIIPYLALPHIDLIKLYTFRNNGCVLSTNNSRRTSNSIRNSRNRGGRKGRCGDRSGDGRQTVVDNTQAGAAVVGEVILRLKVELVKEKRRDVHHLIAKAFREFETDTRNIVPLYNYDDANSSNEGDASISMSVERSKPTTTAIVVRWSSHAQRTLLRKKRKHGDDILSSSSSNKRRLDSTHTFTNASTLILSQQQQGDNSYLLCILRKKNQEHLVAINHLIASLKCRTNDIGLAGIKDMRAVTYQFCTLRNVSPFQACKANAILEGRGMQIGNFERVDWHLNQGDLKGNQFEIVVRDLKRVTIRVPVRRAAGTNGCDKHIIEEFFQPCDETHIDEMVQRLRKSGFINYYGEQRVGESGHTQEVGVRSMDIGRAMLKADFTTAIHLLMMGRLKGKDGTLVEGPDSRHTRKIWINSHGDPIKTLASFPKGVNGYALARERIVLKGLKRYGKDKPLEALRCLQYNIRLFWINAYQSYVWNKMATERILRLGPNPVLGDLYILPHGKKNEVAIVSDLSSIKITDIVLPLPGYNMQYPDNEIGGLYRKLLNEEGVLFEKDAIPEATAKGSYRHLVRVPHAIKWEVIASTKISHAGEDGNDDKTKQSESIEAAKFTFSLDSGSYATMLLRELMVSIISR